MSDTVREPGEEWIEQVVRDNAQDLLGYFLRRTRTPDDAADLLGALLLIVWRRSIDVPRDGLDARRWCFGVARNLVREGHRSAVRRQALAAELGSQLAPVLNEVPDPSTIAVMNERAVRVRAAVANLDEISRELVVLVHWDGFSLAEAATHLQVNSSTARTRYARARARLRSELRAEVAGEDEEPSIPLPTGRRA